MSIFRKLNEARASYATAPEVEVKESLSPLQEKANELATSVREAVNVSDEVAKIIVEAKDDNIVFSIESDSPARVFDIKEATIGSSIFKELVATCEASGVQVPQWRGDFDNQFITIPVKLEEATEVEPVISTEEVPVGETPVIGDVPAGDEVVPPTADPEIEELEEAGRRGRAVKVIRDGQIKLRRLGPKRPRTAAQKRGQLKASRKAHTAAAQIARAKSMKIRSRLIKDDNERINESVEDNDSLSLDLAEIVSPLFKTMEAQEIAIEAIADNNLLESDGEESYSGSFCLVLSEVQDFDEVSSNGDLLDAIDEISELLGLDEDDSPEILEDAEGGLLLRWDFNDKEPLNLEEALEEVEDEGEDIEEDEIEELDEARFKLAVRGGKLKKIKRRIGPKKRRTPAQKAALRKATRMSHTGAALAKRRRSLKIRSRLIGDDNERIDEVANWRKDSKIDPKLLTAAEIDQLDQLDKELNKAVEELAAKDAKIKRLEKEIADAKASLGESAGLEDAASVAGFSETTSLSPQETSRLEDILTDLEAPQEVMEALKEGNLTKVNAFITEGK